MNSIIDGELHFPECELRRGMPTIVSRVNSNGPTRCEICPDCRKPSQFLPKTESDLFRKSIDEIIKSERVKYFNLPRQQELPFGSQKFTNNQIVHNSTAMVQTPPELFKNDHTLPHIREQIPEKQSFVSSVPQRKAKVVTTKKRSNNWKKAVKAVKHLNLYKPFPADSQLTAENPLAKDLSGDANKVENNNVETSVKQPNCITPKKPVDEKGDGTKINDTETYNEQKTLQLLALAEPVQKISVSEKTRNPWKMRTNSEKSAEKVRLWMAPGLVHTNVEPKLSQNDGTRNRLKQSISSIGAQSREEHLKQLHESIRGYISYLQSRAETTDENPESTAGSSGLNVQIDADRLLNVCNNPMRPTASDFRLNVPQSITDAVINADGVSAHDQISQIIKLRDKHYGKICDRLKELFAIIRLLDDVSGLNKPKILNKIKRNSFFLH